MNNEDELLEPLGNGIKIYTSKFHKFSTDTLLLADFVKPSKYEKAADFGTGCGAIPLFWATKVPPKFTLAIEIQESAFNLAKKSIDLNKLSDKIKAVKGDIKDYALKSEEKHSFDLVVCNPPYKSIGSGLQNKDDIKKLARHEIECSIDDVAKAASNFLKNGGRLCLCQRPERLVEVMSSMRKFKIEPKRLRFVQARKNKSPKLFMIEGKYGRNPGLTVMPTLILEESDGARSEELKKIYMFYGEN